MNFVRYLLPKRHATYNKITIYNAEKITTYFEFKVLSTMNRFFVSSSFYSIEIEINLIIRCMLSLVVTILIWILRNSRIRILSE